MVESGFPWHPQGSGSVMNRPSAKAFASFAEPDVIVGHCAVSMDRKLAEDPIRHSGQHREDLLRILAPSRWGAMATNHWEIAPKKMNPTPAARIVEAGEVHGGALNKRFGMDFLAFDTRNHAIDHNPGAMPSKFETNDTGMIRGDRVQRVVACAEALGIPLIARISPTNTETGSGLVGRGVAGRFSGGILHAAHEEDRAFSDSGLSYVRYEFASCCHVPELSKRPQLGFDAAQVRFLWASLATGSGWLNKESRKAGRRSAESSIPDFLPS